MKKGNFFDIWGVQDLREWARLTLKCKPLMGILKAFWHNARPKVEK